MDTPRPALVDSAIDLAERAMSYGAALPLGAMSSLVDPPGHSLALIGPVSSAEQPVLKIYMQTALIRARTVGSDAAYAGTHAGEDAVAMLTTYARERTDSDEGPPLADELLRDAEGMWLFSIWHCDQRAVQVWTRQYNVGDQGVLSWGEGDWIGPGEAAAGADNWVDQILVTTVRNDIPEFNIEVARQVGDLLRFPDVRAWKERTDG